ncbi:MAG: PEP-CTERM sorting domain-containing protein [Planctomycetota bacterium]
MKKSVKAGMFTGLLVFSSAFLGMQPTAEATLLYHEGFGYGLGELSAASGGVWTPQVQVDNNNSGDTPQWEVGAGSLTYSKNGNSVATSGNTAVAYLPGASDQLIYSASLGQTFSSGTIWIGWLQVASDGGFQDTGIAFDNIPAANLPFLSTGNNTAVAEELTVAVFDNDLEFDAPGNGILVDTGLDGVDDAETSAVASSENADFIVLEVDLDNDLFDLYVNPDPLNLNDNDYSFSDMAFNGDISVASIFRFNDFFAGDFTGWYDEIRIATSYAEVTGIPEPSSLMMLSVAGLLSALRRR